MASNSGNKNTTKVLLTIGIALLTGLIIALLAWLSPSTLITLLVMALVVACAALLILGISKYLQGNKLLGVFIVLLGILFGVGAGVALGSTQLANSHLVPGP